jgi:carbon monoxide dehydrogenase subunit G
LTDEFVGSADLSSSPAATWAVLDDPAAIGRILPNCESITPDGSGGLDVVVAVQQMFMTVRLDLHVTWHDRIPPTSLRLQLDGRPRGLGGALHLAVPVELVPIPSGTRVAYHATLTLEGALGSVRKQVADGLKLQVDRLLQAVEREANAA